MSQHFGHCEQFALINVDEERKQVVKKELVQSPGHQPGFLPQWLADHGVSVVIAGGMGMRAQSLFQQNGIRVIIGALENDPEKAVLSHLDGRLATGDNICDH
jgi:predicted Fe-Mo cluster-binding NifX family protein